ncbi:MAG TPA: DNA polymerase subunit beta, partial [Candidatus Margulisbacteria bacterium]|nr:DNA polymerase subunit beta [Candidatus Margulisiibacteriota bacterium]
KKISKPKAIYLFGSYASGSPHENSDLDIAVIKNNVQDKHKELYEIRKALFNFGIPMDLVLFDDKSYKKQQSIYGTVQYEIAHKGKRLA